MSTTARVVLPSEQDAIDAAAYWRDKPWKKFAVDAVDGPERRPTWSSTFYVGARSAERALAYVRAELLTGPHRRARLRARLAGPRELGCVPTGASA